jgi:alkylhydroperoxidase family enzyme
MSVVTEQGAESTPAAAPLTPLLRDAMVSWEVLAERHGPLLDLVETVLGVVPNCDRYLEIWPPAFRTYNVLVPNFLNLPVPVLGLGGPPPAVVGLAMYVASRTAACPYCSAHSCSFAMRRGASPETVAAALLPERASVSRGELATIAVARSLARVPCELTRGERTELLDVYGERSAEWIVLGAAMMGFLNKFMDAVGVELEQSVVAEVGPTMGPHWSAGKAGVLLDSDLPDVPPPPVDGWRTRLRLLPLLPAAIRFDRRCQRGVPSRWPAVGEYLRERTGHDFPVLARLRSSRARRSIASMVRENLDPASSVVGIDVKVLAGAVFAEIVQDEHLAGDVRALARHASVDGQRLDDAVAVARGDDSTLPAGDRKTAVTLRLARAASSSPARIDATTVAACRDVGLSAVAVVEIVTWLSVLQMLHRLTCFAVVAE